MKLFFMVSNGSRKPDRHLAFLGPVAGNKTRDQSDIEIHFLKHGLIHNE